MRSLSGSDGVTFDDRDDCVSLVEGLPAGSALVFRFLLGDAGPLTYRRSKVFRTPPGKSRSQHDLSQRVEAPPEPPGLPVDFLAGSHSSNGTREQARPDRRQESRGGGIEAPSRRIQEARRRSPGSKPEQTRRSCGLGARARWSGSVRGPGRRDGDSSSLSSESTRRRSTPRSRREISSSPSIGPRATAFSC